MRNGRGGGDAAVERSKEGSIQEDMEEPDNTRENKKKKDDSDGDDDDKFMDTTRSGKLG